MRYIYLSCVLSTVLSSYALAGRFEYSYTGLLEPRPQYAPDDWTPRQLLGDFAFDSDSNSGLRFELNFRTVNGITTPHFANYGNSDVSNLTAYFTDGDYWFSFKEGQFDTNAAFAVPQPGYNPDGYNARFKFATDLTGDPTGWSIGISDISNDQPFANRPISPFTNTFDNRVPGETIVSEWYHLYDLAVPEYNIRDYDPWAEVKPPKHIIALTHGFSKSSGSGSNYLSDRLRPIIESRLLRAGVDLENIEFVDAPWSEAFTFPDYDPALSGAAAAGARIAASINEIASQREDDDPFPSVHLIGHSLGTVVNAFASERLNLDEISQLQVTMLDTPREVGLFSRAVLSPELSPIKRAAASAVAGLFYWDTIPANTSSTPVAVENFFAEERYDSLFDNSFFDLVDLPFVDDQKGGAAFGQPIAGTNPTLTREGRRIGVGMQVEGVGHGGIYDDFYASVVQQDDGIRWVTPALGESFGNRLLLPWEPEGLADRFVAQLAAASDEIALRIREDALPEITSDELAKILFTTPYLYNDRAIVAATEAFLDEFASACTADSCPLPILNQSEIIDAWMHDLGAVEFDGVDGFTLITNSPSSILARANLESVVAFEFQYAIAAEESGILEVFVGEDLVFTTAGTDTHGTGFAEVLGYAGTQEITWRFNSDAAGATVRISDLAFLEVVAVPEPSSLSFGLILLCSSTLLTRCSVRRASSR